MNFSLEQPLFQFFYWRWLGSRRLAGWSRSDHFCVDTALDRLSERYDAGIVSVSATALNQVFSFFKV